MKKYDLTNGNITLQMIQLALPLIMGNILQQLYNTIDALVIGRYAGQAEFAAIGIAGSVMNLFLFAIVGACTGISVIFSQQYGMKNMNAFRHEHFLALISGLMITILGSLGGIFLLPHILRIIQTPSQLFPHVKTYLVIILLGLPAAFLYNLYNSLLRAIGKTGASLLVLACSVCANMFLDILFIARLGLGISGAAFATVLAEILSAVLCIIYLRIAFPDLIFHRSDCRMDKYLFRKTIHYGMVTGLHQSGLYIGKLLVQGAVNTGGPELITAYTATTRIEGFANSFGDSGAAATSVMVGQNYGAGKKQRIQKIFRKSLLLLFLLGILSSVIMYISAGATAGFLIGNPNSTACEQAKMYLRIIAVFYPFCFTGNTFAGYFDGCGRVSIPFVGAISHISLRVILSWIFVSEFGLNAVAVSTGIGWILVNIFWGIIKLKKKN